MMLLYRILTYLLLPLGVLLGLLTLASLMASLANIAALLPTFICGATVIYIFTSFVFVQQGLVGRHSLKRSLYDWIRVNGFVALFLANLFIFQSIYFRNNPELNEQLQAQFDAMADQVPAGSMPDLQKVINMALNFMLAAGILLVTHILISFSYLKRYMGLFSR